MTVKEAQARVSSREFAEWLAYERVEPDLELRVDFGFALLASILVNSNRDPKKRNKPYGVEDFLPKWDHEDKPARPSKTELKVKLQQFAGLMKGMKKK